MLESENAAALLDKGSNVLLSTLSSLTKSADWLVDLGPQGGHRGGEIVAEGTPEDVARVEESYTGQFLRPILGAAGRLPRMETDTEGVRLVRDAGLGVPAG